MPREFVTEGIAPNERAIARYLDVREPFRNRTLDSAGVVMNRIRAVFCKKKLDRSFARGLRGAGAIGDSQWISRAGIGRVVVADEDLVAEWVFDL